MSLVFTCSVDDGHPADLRVAELLQRHGLRATFYLPIRNSEGPPVLGAAQMRELGRHFEIGSHTYDHRFLARLSARSAALQVERGKLGLQDILGRPVDGFCYPGGAYLRRDVDLVRRAGFRYARTTRNLCLDAGARRYELPTTCQFYPHSRAVYLRNYVRGRDWRQRWNGLGPVLAHADWERRLHALLEAARRRGGVFHLWLHSRDIEQLALWPALAALFARIADVTAPELRLSNDELVSRCFSEAPAAKKFSA